MIRAVGLVKYYGKRKVLKGINIVARKGEVVGLLGPNGAGKTTSFRIILGEIPSDGGRVYFKEKEISSLPMYRRIRMGLGYLPQEPSAFKGLSVEENIMAYLQFSGLPRPVRIKRMNQVIEEMGLSPVRFRKAIFLSGGERRRLEIARALSLNPEFLFLDEPFTGIDPIAVKEMRMLVRSLKDKGVGIIITDHNVRETLKITDRAYIISNGKILKEGNPRELSEDPLVKKVYLGEKFKLENETETEH
ncbi:MAG: LPS export ABC transporter ATP-binding protein [Candidatus Aminicenantes bacterium]|nr:LPS export ABC transporter ATP-binding protein [Candidatus Aminicenantes bacterium]